MITEKSDGEIEVKLIDFNVSRRFRDEETCTKYLM